MEYLGLERLGECVSTGFTGDKRNDMLQMHEIELGEWVSQVKSHNNLGPAKFRA